MSCPSPRDDDSPAGARVPNRDRLLQAHYSTWAATAPPAGYSRPANRATADEASRARPSLPCSTCAHHSERVWIAPAYPEHRAGGGTFDPVHGCCLGVFDGAPGPRRCIGLISDIPMTTRRVRCPGRPRRSHRADNTGSSPVAHQDSATAVVYEAPSSSTKRASRPTIRSIVHIEQPFVTKLASQ